MAELHSNLQKSQKRLWEKLDSCLLQSHYIEVAQGDIFMEQKMRFGLVLGWLVKVSKSQKQIIWSSHTPKNQQKISHFLP
jgi:hypothetical protein